ncbi:hypothetical protein GcM3_223003 [Golovinomyces cichoracearum]|uniref:Uncharacterized protein n=1 Tax=Golovinomyces cichoracearum TaxID=62708 RepID=A0A420H1I7_9PEZI|nr:hypothetical protein GcM3_223003 [Golovinomyces cichoracearum]
MGDLWGRFLRHTRMAALINPAGPEEYDTICDVLFEMGYFRVQRWAHPEFLTNEIYMSMMHVKRMERNITIRIAPRKASSDYSKRIKKEGPHSKAETPASIRRGLYSRYSWLGRLE